MQYNSPTDTSESYTGIITVNSPNMTAIATPLSAILKQTSVPEAQLVGYQSLVHIYLTNVTADTAVKVAELLQTAGMPVRTPKFQKKSPSDIDPNFNRAQKVSAQAVAPAAEAPAA